MPYTNRYIPGDRLMTCDICGFDYRYSDMRKGVALGQKGRTVCPVDFDEPHERDTTPKLAPARPLPKVR